MSKKVIKLAILGGVVYLLSFAASAYAIDRGWYYGYFTNSYDSSGDYVLQNDANDGGGCSGYGGNRGAHYNSSTGGYDAIWPSVNSANTFISEIEQFLNSNRCDNGTANNAKNWDNTGAAFIIQTMLGTSRNRPPTGAEIADWEGRVRAAEAAGRVNWNTYVSAAPNTFYQISRNDGSSSVNDVAWYNSTGSGNAIVFYNSDGSIAYMIRRQCANPLGNPLPLDNGWYGAGSTTVSDSTPDPGDTPYSITTTPGSVLTFTHKIKNLGPASNDIWYMVYNNANNIEGTYQADYFANTSLSGAPAFTRYEAGIYHNWAGSSNTGMADDGDDSPIGKSNFSVRWSRTDYFQPGDYTFTTATDDGVRLYVDGNLVIDHWITEGVTQYSTSPITLSAGRHSIVMEYFQGAGGYYAAMWYSYMSGGVKVSTAYDAQYYNSFDLSGAPVVTRTDPEVNFRWGTGAPGNGINADFSTRWTRYAYFPAGSYTFHTRSDDGVRVCIDSPGTACSSGGTLAINDWTVHGSTPDNSAAIALTEGVHKVIMEHFDSGGGAEAGLSWTGGILVGGSDAGVIAAGTEKNPATTTTMTVPANAAPGSRWCQTMLWDWASNKGGQEMYDGGSAGSADMGGSACATVKATANDITPSITVSVNGTAGNFAEPGDTVAFTYGVNNATSSTSGSASCTYKQATYAGYDSTAPTTSFTPVGANCPPSRTFPANATTTTVTESVSSVPANSSLCRSLTVSPAAPDGSSRTAQACAYVISKPFAKVNGGDVAAGAGVITSSGTCTTNNGAAIIGWNKGVSPYQGASVQFAAYALSTILSVATSTNGSGSGAPPVGLSFANTSTNTAAGNYGGSLGSVPCIPDYFSRNPNSAPNLAATLSGSLASGNYYRSGSLTISTSSIAAGNSVSVFVNGDVYISGSITYGGSGSWNSGNIPLFQLIAKGNIYIAPGVAQLDGLYVAQSADGTSNGVIYTCATGLSAPVAISSLSASCGTSLTVNGGFVARQVQLMRVAGSLGNGNPAEVFNYNPIWITQPSGLVVTPPQYNAITSLPPVL